MKLSNRWKIRKILKLVTLDVPIRPKRKICFKFSKMHCYKSTIYIKFLWYESWSFYDHFDSCSVNFIFSSTKRRSAYAVEDKVLLKIKGVSRLCSRSVAVLPRNVLRLSSRGVAILSRNLLGSCALVMLVRGRHPSSWFSLRILLYFGLPQETVG